KALSEACLHQTYATHVEVSPETFFRHVTEIRQLADFLATAGRQICRDSAIRQMADLSGDLSF
ncbi:MAG: hypothetical protein ACI4LS_12835, partial [Treponema sp.]